MSGMIKKPKSGITIDSKNPKAKKSSPVVRQVTTVKPKASNTIKPLRFFQKKR